MQSGMLVFLLSLLILILTLVVVRTSSAQDFTAKFLGDYGNVTMLRTRGKEKILCPPIILTVTSIADTRSSSLNNALLNCCLLPGLSRF